MSLYDDDDIDFAPEPKEDVKAQSEVVLKDEEKTVPATNLSFLKAQLESKRAQIQFKVKAPTIGPSPIQQNAIQNSLGPPPAKKPATASLLKPRRVQPLKIDASTTFSIIPKALKEDKVFLFNEIVVEDEYNPTAPTDYHSFKAKREAQLARERAAREIAERLEKEHAEEIAKRGKGAMIAPPMELMEPSVVEPPQIVEESIPKKDVVSNMMSRMGWKGFGLGKDQQGISTALKIKKIGKSTGMIINESKDVTENLTETPEDLSPVNITELLKNASKVVLVKNMATTTDVDSEFKREITEEMSKYGQVEDVVIHLAENSSENVRIFVGFTNQAQAVKAVIDLNKRFFNGRAIRATFYNIDDFEAKNYDR